MDCRHKEAAPFSMKQPDGSWRGISIDLWEQIAKNEGYTFEYREMSLEEMLQGLENNQIDLAVAALTITPDREKAFDFSHAFYNTGLSVAVRTTGGNTYWQLFLGLFSKDFLQVVAAPALLPFCRRRAGLAGGTPPQSRTIWRHGDARARRRFLVVGSHDDHRRLWR
ncbi:MAG: transporter substrate-binding domain-containing protein [Calditrichia bacterium]